MGRIGDNAMLNSPDNSGMGGNCYALSRVLLVGIVQKRADPVLQFIQGFGVGNTEISCIGAAWEVVAGMAGKKIFWALSLPIAQCSLQKPVIALNGEVKNFGGRGNGGNGPGKRRRIYIMDGLLDESLGEKANR